MALSSGVGSDSDDLPRSLMFITPAALELVRRWPPSAPFFSSFGDDERPLTAESTLERSCVSADMMAVWLVVAFDELREGTVKTK